jgi:formylglycine-generating enzyme required for sulfatase activity
MAYKPTFQFSLKPELYAATPVPSLSDWEALWAVWDAVTQEMIPKDELLAKPIKLRNACIFYLGHIPTFLAIHLHKAAGKIPQGLAEYQRIFERGIDPDVDNPELCHDHSEIPDEYPLNEEILAFQDRVRAQVQDHYASKDYETHHAVKKALWIGFEHELMHLETLLYMLVQSEKTLPPPNSIFPDFEAMAASASTKAVPNSWVEIPARSITLGLHDDDRDVDTRRYFGWDNEKPQRQVDVHAFTVQARPITNGEYADYLDAVGSKSMPASWTTSKRRHDSLNNDTENGMTNGASNGESASDGKSVRTVFGPVPLKFALDWPVMASYDELAAYAAWSGGRIPTLEEVKSVYAYAEESKAKEVENTTQTIPAVNG